MICGAALAALLATPAAMAQEATVTGNVSLVTDYQWRNVTQSNHDITVQGGLDLGLSNGVYAGIWGSGVDFNTADDTNTEVDLYGGYRFDLSGIGVDVGLIYYAYPDSEADDINFYEIYGKLSKTFGNFTIGGSVNYDPDNENVFVDASASVALTDAFSLSANVGSAVDCGQTFAIGVCAGAAADDFEYVGWNVGGAYTIMGATLGIRYFDNDIDNPTFDHKGYVFSIGRTM
jgi:uncharacterized protein (TIGR02001 family)